MNYEEDVWHPLSAVQRSLWFEYRTHPESSGLRNISFCVRVLGELDAGHLRQALNVLAARYPILRAKFREIDGTPSQCVDKGATVEVSVSDVGDLSDEQLEHSLAEETVKPFDLTAAPLVRAGIYRRPGQQCILLLVFDHLIIDGWSFWKLIDELGKILEGKQSDLTSDASGSAEPDYFSYIHEQQEWLESKAAERQLGYWHEVLGKDDSVLDLPTDRPRAQSAPLDTDNTRMVLSAKLTDALRQLAKKHRVTLYVVVLAAYLILLHRVTGQDSVTTGSPVPARGNGRWSDAMGTFINIVTLRALFEPSLTLGDLIRQIQSVAFRALRNQDYPLTELVKQLNPSRAHDRAPFFQNLFVFHNARGANNLSPLMAGKAAGSNGAMVAWGGFETSCWRDPPDGDVGFDLTLKMIETDEEIVAGLYYAPTLFERGTIERWGSYWIRLLEGMVADDSQVVDRVDLLGEEERRLVVGDWNATAAAYPQDECIHELFEEQVWLAPEAVAVVCGGRKLCYGELNVQANHLARHLRKRGVMPGDCVVILLERSIELVVAELAVLKCAAAYVPIDASFPEERQAFMIRDCAANVVLITQGKALPTGLSATRVDVDVVCSAARVSGNLKVAVSSEAAAYVMYTSGSTGTPKGVVIPHRAIGRLVLNNGYTEFGPSDRVAFVANPAFDATTMEVWGPLLNGGCIVVIDQDTVLDPERFAAVLKQQAVTVMFLTTALFNSYAAVPGIFSSLRVLLTGGDRSDPSAFRQTLLAGAPRRLVHCYGPTETTTYAITHDVVAVADGASTIPLGRPISNTTVYILDEHGAPVPVGVAGELYIGGPGVGRGYLNRPDLTAERFVADPFAREPGARMYRTGDLGRWLSDGTIEFLGRNDFQVKLRGFRIELGEIEARLTEQPTVREATVVAREDSPGDKRLVAYYTGEAGVGAEELRAHLAGRLPDYMVPAAYVRLEALPLTPNGKLDRDALPLPAGDAYAGRSYEAPQGEVEEKLAEIWSELLKIERVGRNDNFFELGGHSLLAITLIERLRQQGLQTDVRTLFGAPTLSGLAAALGGGGGVEVPANLIPAGCEAITPAMLPLVELSQAEIDGIAAHVVGGAANIQDIYPLVPLQEGMLFHHLMGGDGDAYLTLSLMAFDGRDLLDGFVAALQAVIDRHDILRTAVAWEGLSQPVQVVWRRAAVAVEEVELNPAAGDAGEQLRTRFDARRYRLDVRQAPLLRMFVTHDEARDRWLLLLLHHHLVMDHTALEVMGLEVQAHVLGRAAELPAQVPFRNFVVQVQSGVSVAEHEAFFRGMLGDVDEPTAPFGLVDIQSDDLDLEKAQVALELNLSARLRERARVLGVSVASLFHLAWGVVVARTSGRRNAVFGTVLFGRMQGGAGADRAIGMLINTLPLRLEIGEEGVDGSVRRVHALLAELLHHEHAPLALAQRCSAVPAPAPLFSSLLNYRHSRPGGAMTFATWEGVEILGGEERTNYPVTLSVDDLGEGFDLTAQTLVRVGAERLCGLMRVALEGLTEALERAPGTAVSRIEILGVDERRLVVEDWNATAAAYPHDKCIHELFEELVKRRHWAIAVVCGGQKLTYGQLNARANGLAHHLRKRGVRPGDRVAILLERSIELVVAELAVLKCGAAYVPIDASFPEQRQAFMIRDCAANVVLITEGKALPTGHSATWVDVDVVCLAAEVSDNPCVKVSSEAAAYVMYTSGSTGMPKGVVIPHRAIGRLVLNNGYAEFEPSDRVAFAANPAFDATTMEVWGPLLNGGCIVVIDQSTVLDPDRFAAVLKQQAVTVLWLTAGLLNQYAESLAGVFPHLRYLLAGGDALDPRTLRRVLDSGAPRHLLNGYGPTETTTFAITHEIVEVSEGTSSIPLGRPISNTQVYILDEHGFPVPIGVAGELYIGGSGVGCGYLNRPDLTAERFVADPFAQEPGARMYRTGDLGRWLSDGTIEFLGRNDFQVKLRGFRIELGEIEARLTEQAGVRDAAVVAREDVPGDKRLVAYYTGEPGVGAEELRAHLAGRLPDYMVPAAYVRLEVLPLTPNGKLDRNALPVPGGDAYAGRGYEAPQGEVEEKLAAIWSELLKIERVSRRDNFFELGGHSLLAVQLVSRMRQALNIEVPLSGVFAHPVLVDFAGGIADAPISTLPAITAAGRDGTLPLSFAQQRLWFLAQFKGASAAYHMPGGLRLQGELDRLALIKALARIVARHEALRTTFVVHDGEASQRILAADIGFALTEHDLSGVADAEARLDRLAAAEAAMPFDLEQGPLIRGRLVRLAKDDHALLVTMHHIVSDGWSMGVLTRELTALYEANVRGKEDPLPPLLVQYADYAVWQRRWLAGEVLKRQAKYWKEALTGAPALLTLPTDHERPAEPDYAGASVEVRLEPKLSRALKELSLRHGMTLHMTLLAGFAVLLARLSGQDEVVIGSPVANRSRAEIADLIGFFVNTVALRIDVSGSPSFWEVLGRAKAVSLSAQEHQDLPFEQVVEIVQPPRSMSYTPVFQAVFAWQNVPQGKLELSGLKVTPVDSGPEAAKFDLTLLLEEAGEEIEGRLIYAKTLFDGATIERWVGYWVRLLEGMVADESQAVDRIDMLGADERRLVVQDWNATTVVYPQDKCIHELFETQVERTPEAVAVVCGGRELTYGELNARANRLAHHLHSRGVRPDDRVAICVERSIEMVVALLAVLKAGGGYVPLDPSYPADRLGYMIADSAPVVVLSDVGGRRALIGLGGSVPVIDIGDEAEWAKELESNPDLVVGLTPQHLAYVIYTSGSTGTPKGVMIAHRELSNLVQWHCVTFDLKAGERSSCVAGFGFDAASWEIWPALCVGAGLLMAPPSIARNPIELVEWWQCQPVDVSFLPTPIAEIVLGRAKYPARLRTLLTGGDRLHQRPPQLRSFKLVNNYGPTETTVVATSGPIEADDAVIHIGRPISNTRVYILDEQGAPVPVGVAGELNIGGVQVGRGYLNRPDLTAERFVADPFAQEPGTRMYRTGDLGQWLSDGNIEFLGRNDFQVKIRGFRIELGEIEARLTEQVGVREAAVVAREDVPGDKRLVAYYTGEAGVGAEELRGHLAASLPDYMVPAAYVRLEALPLTPNGKLNRNALPLPGGEAYAGRGYEAPQGELEEKLAAIWSELLKIDRVGRNDNFFELGGHSLLAITLIERLRQQGLQADVRTLFGAPTLGRLAAALGQSAVETYVELAEAAILPDDIQPLFAPPAEKPARILLTGATGFVGRFLLRQLLDQGTHRVMCLSRCTDSRTGFERLHQTLKRWSLWRPGDEDRIEVLPGDLSAPRLGLSEADYRRACDEPDAIFHAATSMNHLESFESARKANVEGVAEILRLGARGRPKTLNYVSTMGVFSTIGHEGAREVDEATSIESERHLFANGYTTSKWVGEQLVHLAGRRGLPCNVYRLGLITGDTELGRYDEQQTFHRLLESCIRIGAGFGKFRYDQMITPVDYTARALVRLGNDHSQGGGVFHLSSMTVTPIEAVFASYNEVAEPPLAILSYWEWLGRIRERFEAGETLPIMPLVHSLLNMDDRTLEAFTVERDRATLRFDCSRTRAELEQAGVVMPPFNAHLMSTYLRGMLAANPTLNTLVKIVKSVKTVHAPSDRAALAAEKTAPPSTPSASDVRGQDGLIVSSEQMKKPKHRFRPWKPIAAAVIIAAVGVAWWFLGGPAVTAVQVTHGTAVEIVYATGSVEPETWSRMTPLVRGRIVERCRCEGSTVKAGQRLARLDDREGQAVLKDLRAQQSFELMQFERQNQLLEKGATTSQAYQKSAIDLARIRAQVAAQLERLKYYELSAPMDGIVLKEDGEVGDMVDPGTILYRVGLPKPLWVVAEVNEEDIPRVAIGQKALLRTDAFPGKVLEGYVKQITPAGDPVAKTFRVRIGLPDDTPLHIGMTAEVNIVTREKPNALLVPANAVIDNSLLIIRDGRPMLREVSIGIRGTSNIEIVSGAEEGELIVSPATANIKDVSHVRVTTIDARVAPLAPKATDAMEVSHDRDPPATTLSDGSIRNAYTVTLLNKADVIRHYTLAIEGIDASIKIVGRDNGSPIAVEPNGSESLRVTLTMANPSDSKVVFIAKDEASGTVLSASDRFVVR